MQIDFDIPALCRYTMTRGKNTSWIFVSLNILLIFVPQIVESLFQIVLVHRDANSNVVTLQCRLNATDQPVLDAGYFLNGSHFTEVQSGDNNEVTFLIDRDKEVV